MHARRAQEQGLGAAHLPPAPCSPRFWKGKDLQVCMVPCSALGMARASPRSRNRFSTASVCVSLCQPRPGCLQPQSISPALRQPQPLQLPQLPQPPPPPPPPTPPPPLQPPPPCPPPPPPAPQQLQRGLRQPPPSRSWVLSFPFPLSPTKPPGAFPASRSEPGLVTGAGEASPTR